MGITAEQPTLKEEREFFETSSAEWLKTSPGKMGLIKGSKLIGLYDTENEAIAEGARLFQLTPFLVRPIAPAQPEVYIPALALGLLTSNANPKPTIS